MRGRLANGRVVAVLVVRDCAVEQEEIAYKEYVYNFDDKCPQYIQGTAYRNMASLPHTRKASTNTES